MCMYMMLGPRDAWPITWDYDSRLHVSDPSYMMVGLNLPRTQKQMYLYVIICIIRALCNDLTPSFTAQKL